MFISIHYLNQKNVNQGDHNSFFIPISKSPSHHFLRQINIISWVAAGVHQLEDHQILISRNNKADHIFPKQSSSQPILCLASPDSKVQPPEVSLPPTWLWLLLPATSQIDSTTTVAGVQNMCQRVSTAARPFFYFARHRRF